MQKETEGPAAEVLPFKTLDELYSGLENLKPWPPTVDLRESAEYVFRGADSGDAGVRLEKLHRDQQPRTLVCHDMKGGYLEDRFVSGSASHDAYLFYHWSVVDTFVYFSHHLVTVPPYGWVCAGHAHGVKVLGTVITENTEALEPILANRDSAVRFVEALVRLAKFYKFEGWLLNIENTVKTEHMASLMDLVRSLTERMHQEVEGSEVIWYDSVTVEGKLKWQNELNGLNKEFFLNCDGIYLNYNWTESRLANSYQLANNEGRHPRDIYVGLDVWGRGCPGGGGFNSKHALKMIRDQGLSVAIFAPGWTHEYFGAKSFPVLEDLFWAQLYPFLYVHLPIYDDEAFRSSFCRGSGPRYYKYGEVQLEVEADKGTLTLTERPFYNLALQQPQPSVPVPRLIFTTVTEHVVPQAPEERKEHAVQDGSRVDSEDKGETGKEEDKAKEKKTMKRFVYETSQCLIKIEENRVDFETKAERPEFNRYEFCDRFSFEGGGCLKIVTVNPQLHHRLFLVHVEFPRETEATIVFQDTETGEPTNPPILVLGNSNDLESIAHSRTEKLNSKWSKCWYPVNLRTIQEVGVSFNQESVNFLGAISLERHREYPDLPERTTA